MTEEDIITWLEHWLSRQGRGKLPLMLIDPSTNLGRKTVPKVSTNKGKKRMEWVEPDDDSDEDIDGDGVDNEGELAGGPRTSPAPSGTYSERIPNGPPAPADYAETRKNRREFLGMLSEDTEYRRLLSLLERAKVLSSLILYLLYILIVLQPGPLSGHPPLPWASWKSLNSYLPPAFHATSGKESYSALTKWLGNEPVTARNNSLASHQTIEIVALSIGLAMRDIAAIQFQDDSVLPSHLVNSPLQFRQFESLSHCTQDLLKGWEDMYVTRRLMGLYLSFCNRITLPTISSKNATQVPDSKQDDSDTRKKGRYAS